MTPDLAASLKRHLTRLKTELLRTGKGEPEWLFPTEGGALMDKDHLSGVFRRLLKRAGLPYHIVTLDTILRWQRRRFRKYWTHLSGGSTGGRPLVDAEIRALVTRMATATRLGPRASMVSS
jgi:hypothetical protein